MATTPSVTISKSWESMMISAEELRESFLYVAHKTKRCVVVQLMSGIPQLNPNQISVVIPTADSPYPQSVCRQLGKVRFGGEDYIASEGQVRFHLPKEHEGLPQITDELGTILATIQGSNVLVRVDFTAASNDAGKKILYHIAQECVKHFNFEMSESEEALRKIRMQNQLIGYCGDIGVVGRSRVQTSLDQEISSGTSLASQLSESYRNQQTLKRELRALAINVTDSSAFFTSLVDKLIELESCEKGFEKIELGNSSLQATTTPVTIVWNDYPFELGRYEIVILMRRGAGPSITVSAIDHEFSSDGYPHPHISQSGAICLGNIHEEMVRSLGEYHFDQALILTRDLLDSFNEGGEYVHIAKFDTQGGYMGVDPTEEENSNPCEDCEDIRTPYCIHECTNNEGQFSCEDCESYRTEYCFEICDYNEGRIDPCEDCDDSDSDHCYSSCRYNQSWERHNPCDDGLVCDEYPECRGCPYAERAGVTPPGGRGGNR